MAEKKNVLRELLENGKRTGKLNGKEIADAIEESGFDVEKIDKLYLSKLDGFANAEVIVREGIPYVEILKVARENEADLIVMAHHSSDLSDDDADIGSTVEQVVLRSACPVASVTRPEAR